MLLTKLELDKAVADAKEKIKQAFNAKNEALAKLSSNTKLSSKKKEELKGLANAKLQGVNIRCGKGLLIKIQPMTKKGKIKTDFYASVRNENGKDSIKKIGEYPHTSLASARDQAQKLKQASIKKYPKNEEIGSSLKFEAYYKKWLEQWRANHPTERSKNRYFNLKAYYNTILHVIGGYRLSALKPKLIIDKLMTIETSHNNRAYSAKALKQALDDAVNQGLLDTNPAQTITKSPQLRVNPAEKGSYKWVPLEQLRDKFFSKLTNARPINKIYFLLVALMGTRGKELRLLRWNWIDFDNTNDSPYGTLTIPKGLTKTDNVEHVIFLTKQMRAVIDFWNGYIKTFKDKDPFFFSSNDFNNVISENTLKQIITDTTAKDITLHGFRKSFSTYCNEHVAEIGLTQNEVELCVAHKIASSVSLVYNKYEYGKEKYQVWKMWNDALIEQIPNEYLDFGDRKLELIP